MNEGTTIRLAATAVAAAALALVGCSSTEPQAGEQDGVTAAQFVACLTAAGVEATVGDEGHVLVKVAGEGTEAFSVSSSTESGEGALLTMGDTNGNIWVAAATYAYFADEPDTQDAYAACEAELPGFSQPEVDALSDPAVQEQLAQQAEDGLTFARCAREAGFAWVADPVAEVGTSPGIALPADLTEQEFRALLDSCWSPELNISWLVEDELAFDWTEVLGEYADTTGAQGGEG